MDATDGNGADHISPDDKVFKWSMLEEELNYRIKGV